MKKYDDDYERNVKKKSALNDTSDIGVYRQYRSM